MPTGTIRIQCTLAELGGKLRRLGPQIQRAMLAGARDLALKLMAGVKLEIGQTTPHAPVNSGAYRAGWKFKRTPGGAVVFNNEPQAVWIERGRRAGPISQAGFEALKLWVKRKGLWVGALAQATQVVRKRRLGQLGADLLRAEVRAGRMRQQGASGDGGARAMRSRHKREAAQDAQALAIEQTAWAIRDSIAKHGYHARFPLWRAIRALEGQIGQVFAEAMARGIQG